ncbi:hypothetical protein ACWEQ2_08005 [Streptomyces sp. NPDC004096]|uniref:hypothetical protein n=1 Tax=unclassified Streptomyces TaxID=2593676 RepID=UPI0033B29B07
MPLALLHGVMDRHDADRPQQGEQYDHRVRPVPVDEAVAQRAPPPAHRVADDEQGPAGAGHRRTRITQWTGQPAPEDPYRERGGTQQ